MHGFTPGLILFSFNPIFQQFQFLLILYKFLQNIKYILIWNRLSFYDKIVISPGFSFACDLFLGFIRYACSSEKNLQYTKVESRKIWSKADFFFLLMILWNHCQLFLLKKLPHCWSFPPHWETFFYKVPNKMGWF